MLLEQLDGDDVIVRVQATPDRADDGARLADEIIDALASVTGEHPVVVDERRRRARSRRARSRSATKSAPNRRREEPKRDEVRAAPPGRVSAASRRR